MILKLNFFIFNLLLVTKVDMRTVSFDVAPQEVRQKKFLSGVFYISESLEA